MKTFRFFTFFPRSSTKNFSSPKLYQNISNLAWLYGAHFISYFIPLAEMAAYSRIMGIEGYSQYLYAYAIGLTIGFAGEFGLTISGPANQLNFARQKISQKMIHIAFLLVRIPVWGVVLTVTLLAQNLFFSQSLSLRFYPGIIFLSAAISFSQLYYFYMAQRVKAVLLFDLLMRFLPVVFVFTIPGFVSDPAEFLLFQSALLSISVLFQSTVIGKILQKEELGRELKFASVLAFAWGHLKAQWPAALQRLYYPLSAFMYLTAVELYFGAGGLQNFAAPERLIRAGVALAQPAVTFLLPLKIDWLRYRLRIYWGVIFLSLSCVVMMMPFVAWINYWLFNSSGEIMNSILSLFLYAVPIKIVNSLMLQMELLRSDSGAYAITLSLLGLLMTFPLGWLSSQYGSLQDFIKGIIGIESVLCFVYWRLLQGSKSLQSRLTSPG